MEAISCGAIMVLRALGAKPCRINLIATADNCLCTTYAYLYQKNVYFNLYSDIEWQDDFLPPLEPQSESSPNSCLVNIFLYNCKYQQSEESIFLPFDFLIFNAQKFIMD